MARKLGPIRSIRSACQSAIRRRSAAPIRSWDIEHILRVLDHRERPAFAVRLGRYHVRRQRPVNLVNQGDPEANRASFGILSRPEPHGHTIHRGVTRRFINCADHWQSLRVTLTSKIRTYSTIASYRLDLPG